MMGDRRAEQQILERVLADKEQQRRRLAGLPFEEKVAIVRRLQAIAAAAARSREQSG
ncbi:MAG: hypothetical protein HY321_19140 [Armatimonadetes bacterium]|nr:hypothetical protein [Armatimonadota bacterium]